MNEPEGETQDKHERKGGVMCMREPKEGEALEGERYGQHIVRENSSRDRREFTLSRDTEIRHAQYSNHLI